MDELLRLTYEVNMVFESGLDWDVKYDLIFSKKLSQRIAHITTVEWLNMDSSYEEDVTNYVYGLNKHIQEVM